VKEDRRERRATLMFGNVSIRLDPGTTASGKQFRPASRAFVKPPGERRVVENAPKGAAKLLDSPAQKAALAIDDDLFRPPRRFRDDDGAKGEGVEKHPRKRLLPARGEEKALRVLDERRASPRPIRYRRSSFFSADSRLPDPAMRSGRSVRAAARIGRRRSGAFPGSSFPTKRRYLSGTSGGRASNDGGVVKFGITVTFPTGSIFATYGLTAMTALELSRTRLRPASSQPTTGGRKGARGRSVGRCLETQVTRRA
jgi:hypothetical protein